MATEPARQGPNRRRYVRVLIEGVLLEVVRVGITRRLPVAVGGNPKNLALKMVDLSGGGFSMLTWAPLTKGDRLIVKLRVPSWNGEIATPAVIKWTKENEHQGKKCFEAGAEFVDLPSRDRFRLMELKDSGKPRP